MIRLLVARDYNRARIAWTELYDWQRPPSFQHMTLVLTDSFLRHHSRSLRLDESEVMLVGDWDEGQFAPAWIMEAHYMGIKLANCGRLYYD